MLFIFMETTYDHMMAKSRESWLKFAISSVFSSEKNLQVPD